MCGPCLWLSPRLWAGRPWACHGTRAPACVWRSACCYEAAFVWWATVDPPALGFLRTKSSKIVFHRSFTTGAIPASPADPPDPGPPHHDEHMIEMRPGAWPRSVWGIRYPKRYRQPTPVCLIPQVRRVRVRGAVLLQHAGPHAVTHEGEAVRVRPVPIRVLTVEQPAETRGDTRAGGESAAVRPCHGEGGDGKSGTGAASVSQDRARTGGGTTGRGQFDHGEQPCGCRGMSLLVGDCGPGGSGCAVCDVWIVAVSLSRVSRHGHGRGRLRDRFAQVSPARGRVCRLPLPPTPTLPHVSLVCAGVPSAPKRPKRKLSITDRDSAGDGGLGGTAPCEAAPRPLLPSSHTLPHGHDVVTDGGAGPQQWGPGPAPSRTVCVPTHSTVTRQAPADPYGRPAIPHYGHTYHEYDCMYLGPSGLPQAAPWPRALGAGVNAAEAPQWRHAAGPPLYPPLHQYPPMYMCVCVASAWACV